MQKGLAVKEEHKHFILNFEKIIYISSHGNYAILHTIDKDHTIASSLKSLEKQLQDSKFIRIHRQYIINLDFLSHITYIPGGTYMAFLNDDDDTSLPVGRKYNAALKSVMGITNKTDRPRQE
jgi:DNA-binding LytR/AlgR family response regulator